MIKPRMQAAIIFVTLGLSLTGAILGSGIGHLDTAKSAEASASTPAVKLSLPPSTVIHPPMICRQGGCSELKQGAL